MTTIQQLSRRTPRAFAAALVAGVAALVSLATVNAQPTQTYAQVLEGGAKGGALIVWASSPGEQKTYRALFDAFNKRFGLNTRPSSWASTPRVDADASSPKRPPTQSAST
jgi:hypothetical protein